tara:strand:+ start:541 stop:984 length:444 start_codon:yes stop_codon:yes gene_type:complete
MSSILLSLALILTPLKLQIFEEIRITDNLVLKAEYLEDGSQIPHEGMLLTIEDFAIVQAEFISIGTAWEKRIEDLNATHHSELLEQQEICEDQYITLRKDSEKYRAEVDILKGSLKDLRSTATLYKWVSIVSGALSIGGVTYYVLSK